jgi:hypothetical protein
MATKSDDPLKGHEIVAVRPMTDDEAERNFWHHDRRRPVVLELDNGTLVYPSQDPEGNGPGALFGEVDGTPVTFGVEQR